MSAFKPCANPELVGHAPAVAAFVDALRRGRLHHAWLLTGPPGIGKATLAYRFARALLAGSSDAGLFVPPDSPVFRRVATGSHADLRVVQREWDARKQRLRGEIVVDTVRSIAEFLHLTPVEGGWRVVVVDGAEMLNRSAANALLKVLEEPPARAILLLVCAAPGQLPSTVRSRCRRLRLAPLAIGEVERVLATVLPDSPPETRRRLAMVAEGAPGRALAFAEGKGMELAELAGQVLAEAPAIDLARAHAVADAVASDEQAFAIFLERLCTGLATAVRAAARGQADAGQRRLLAGRPLDAWAEVWQGLCRLQDETEALYLERRQAILTGLVMLADTASRVS
jgi:DNA polymerase-3 subunit delta'